jgi:hypothetical protein
LISSRQLCAVGQLADALHVGDEFLPRPLLVFFNSRSKEA